MGTDIPTCSRNALVATLGDLEAAKVALYLHRQAIDTSTPSGKAMFGMLGVFAEFERAMVRIPTKPARHSNLKPATYSDAKPAGVPI